MSKPRYRWWGYVKNVLRAYPSLEREYNELFEPAMTPTLSGMPSGGEVGRKTEATALRELPRSKQRELESVRKAIEQIDRLDAGRDILRVADMVFFKNTHTLAGAAYAIGISYETAKIYQRRFILAVAKNYGLLEEDEKD